MAVRIIKRKMELSGASHERIAEVEWVNPDTNASGRSSRVTMYDFIKNKSGQAFVLDKAGDKAYVGARENSSGTQYIQTYADKVWTDNLLALPQYY